MVSITLFFILLCQTLWFLLLCFPFFCAKHCGFYCIVFHSNEKQSNRNCSVWHSRMKNKVIETIVFDAEEEKQSNRNRSDWRRRMKNKVIEIIVYCVKHWFLLLCFSFFCVKHYGFYYFVFHSSLLSNTMVSITLLYILLCQILWFLLLCFSFYCVKHYGLQSNRNHSVWHRRMKNKVIETSVSHSNRHNSVWHSRMKKKVIEIKLFDTVIEITFFCVKHYGFYYFVFHSSASNTMVSITLFFILLCQTL
jgi:(2Fe-2S) ferredoxin